MLYHWLLYFPGGLTNGTRTAKALCRLREVALLALHSASFGGIRELFKAKTQGLLGFSNSLIHKGRAKSSHNFLTSTLDPPPPPHLLGHKGLVALVVLLLWRHLVWMLKRLKYLVNRPISVIMKNLEYACLYYGIECGYIRRIHETGSVENPCRTCCGGSIKGTAARGCVNAPRKTCEVLCPEASITSFE